jgi:hypothetical protein
VTVARLGAELKGEDGRPFSDRQVIDCQQHVAGSDASAVGWRIVGDFGRHHSGAALDPQHPVFDVVRGRALDDVRNTHRQQQQRRGDGHDGTWPIAPARAGREHGVLSRVDHRKVRRRRKLSKRHTTQRVGHHYVNR